jgi:ribosomal protein S21
MTLNVEVTKSGSENSMSIIRKFSQKMRSTGIVRKMRGRKYWTRSMSPTVKKKQALRRIERSEERTRLIKEGKITEQVQRGRAR